MAQFIDPKSGEVLSLPLQSETSGLHFGDAKMTHISYKKEFSDIRQVTSLRLLVDFAREHDIPALEILKGTELDLDDIEDPYCEIQVWQELRAIQNLLEIDDDPANGVILGMRQHLTCYGTLGFAMMASRTLEQALTIGAKFYKISLWINEVSVVRDPDTIKFVILGHKLPPFSQHFLATRGMAALVTWVQELTNSEVYPCQTSFKNDRPDNMDEVGKAFGTETLFGQKNYSISFNRSLFRMQLKFDDRWSRMRLEDKLSNTLERRHSSTKNRVKEMLLQMSNEKLSTEPEICRALGCSMSTLRRRLHTEETNFRQIQSEVIFERACQLLLSSTMTLEQIAYTLGYSEAGSFCRAFKRVGGMAPGRWRKANTS